MIFYPFKNNQLGVLCGLSPSVHGADYQKRMPFARSWIVLGFIIVLLLIFGLMSLLGTVYVIGAWGRIETLAGLVGVIAISCLLFGFFVVVLMLVFAFLIAAFGRATLLIYQGKVEMHFGVPSFAIVICKEASGVTFELAEPKRISFFPKQGKQFIINDSYSKSTFSLGSNITDSDLASARLAVNGNKGVDQS